MQYAWECDTRIGPLRFVQKDDAITHIVQVNVQPKMPDGVRREKTALIAQAIGEIDEYLKGERREFSFAIDPQGTPFQRRVWAELRRIPYGQVRTYKQVAQAADSPKGYRAVGMANNRNPIIIVQPCHRVVGSDGGMVGFAGGVHIKEKLLKLEGFLR